MNILPFKFVPYVITTLCLCAGLVLAQDWGADDPFGGDPFGGLDTDSPSSDWGTFDSDDQEQGSTYDNDYSGSENTGAGQSSTSTGGRLAEADNNTQDAIIEGIQISTEKGQTDDEKIVSGYFIFRDKPTSYFYETKLREKKIIFEFNDARVGASPVPSVAEAPIKGFTIEEGKVDVNKTVRGLKPEWHNMIRVTFDLDAVPEVHVNDEYSIVSFSFKWTSDPAKVKKYTVKDPKGKIIVLTSSGVAGLGLGAAIIVLATRPPVEPPLKPLETNDLPHHMDFK